MHRQDTQIRPINYHSDPNSFIHVSEKVPRFRYLNTVTFPFVIPHGPFIYSTNQRYPIEREDVLTMLFLHCNSPLIYYRRGRFR